MADLTDIQLDAIKEIGNIGAGNAATALSQLIAEVISVNVPAVKILPLDDVSYALGGPQPALCGAADCPRCRPVQCAGTGDGVSAASPADRWGTA